MAIISPHVNHPMDENLLGPTIQTSTQLCSIRILIREYSKHLYSFPQSKKVTPNISTQIKPTLVPRVQ